MREVVWIGNSLEGLDEFPEEVKDEIGYALYQAQLGFKPRNVKPLTGQATPKQEIELIKQRLKDAKQLEKERGQ